jgi:hypothetical protein
MALRRDSGAEAGVRGQAGVAAQLWHHRRVSDGGAGVIVKLVEVPVLREITLAMLWYSSLCHGITRGDWLWFGLMTLVGIAVGAIYWFQYNRKRKDTGGGFKLLVVIVLMVALLPLLVIAWRRRRAREGAHA